MNAQHRISIKDEENVQKDVTPNFHNALGALGLDKCA